MLGEHAGVIAEWLTVTEAAHKLNLSAPYMRELVVREKFTAIRTHLGWLIDPASVEAYKPARKPRGPRKAQAA